MTACMAGVVTSCLILVDRLEESLPCVASRCATSKSRVWPIRAVEPPNPARRLSKQLNCSDRSSLDLRSKQASRSRSNAGDVSTSSFRFASKTANGVTETILTPIVSVFSETGNYPKREAYCTMTSRSTPLPRRIFQRFEAPQGEAARTCLRRFSAASSPVKFARDGGRSDMTATGTWPHRLD